MDEWECRFEMRFASIQCDDGVWDCSPCRYHHLGGFTCFAVKPWWHVMKQLAWKCLLIAFHLVWKKWLMSLASLGAPLYCRRRRAFFLRYSARTVVSVLLKITIRLPSTVPTITCMQRVSVAKWCIWRGLYFVDTLTFLYPLLPDCMKAYCR